MKRRALVVTSALLGLLLVGCSSSGSSGDTTAVATSTVASSDQHVFEAEHFATGAIVGTVTTEDCTLSGGTETTCARVTVAGYPTTYEVGPFCPTSIATTAADAGIWFDGKGLYDLDGPFVKNLATLYGDSAWKLYDADGKVNITDTNEAFEGAARPDADAKYHNHCVEGRLEWLTDGKPVQTTMLIPTTPVRAASASSAQPGNFGITLDGVVIAESAPVDAILGAHTIAAFDDCGGHYNAVAGYHLHGVTGCGHLEGDDTDGETKMFGYAADGYPIHLPLTGTASTTTKLDACNGHTTKGEGYHYHANPASKNAILPCLTGEYVSTGGDGGRPPGPPPGRDLASIASTLGVTTHELEDAMATGDVETAAEMLGTTAAELAKTLGVSVADVQAAMATTTTLR